MINLPTNYLSLSLSLSLSYDQHIEVWRPVSFFLFFCLLFLSRYYYYHDNYVMKVLNIRLPDQFSGCHPIRNNGRLIFALRNLDGRPALACIYT